MANIGFGQNILPKVNNTYSLGNSDNKWNLYVNEINGTALSSLIPDVSGFYTKPSGGIPAADLAETYLTASTEKWSDYTISLSTTTSYMSTLTILVKNNDSITTHVASKTPTADYIPIYDNSAYLNSTTPSSDDNSTKVATTAFVQTAISGLGSSGGSGLPSVSSTDNGKILQVSSGAWSIVTPNFLTSHQDISGKANSADLATVATTGSYNDLLNKPDLSSYLTSVPTMTGATSSAAGATGLVPAPTSADVDKFLAGDGTYKSGGLPMVILSYGNSTWAEFEAAYNNNVIVYTRASSNSNPATGSQTRMAFMAYVNNATTPTEVEFQYYRSMSSHSATAMGDQVFVYKLTKTGGWSVTSRDASIKEIKIDSSSSGTVSWSNNVVTLKSGLPKVTASDDGKILKVVNGAWAAVRPE